ncbi:universal stress protein [Streptomyces mirabilis]|uniref:universal stress protein n=1 Tax=Streptomyces mirabilis TaxID=68239 RepID=UPI0036B4EBEA
MPPRRWRWCRTTDRAHVVPGEAAEVLVREGNDAFALVTGSRGRGELKELLLGSVGLAVAGRPQRVLRAPGQGPSEPGAGPSGLPLAAAWPTQVPARGGSAGSVGSWSDR